MKILDFIKSLFIRKSKRITKDGIFSSEVFDAPLKLANNVQLVLDYLNKLRR